MFWYNNEAGCFAMSTAFGWLYSQLFKLGVVVTSKRRSSTDSASAAATRLAVLRAARCSATPRQQRIYQLH